GDDTVEEADFRQGGEGEQCRGKGDAAADESVIERIFKHESIFRGLIAVNAFTENVVDALAGTGQAAELNLEEDTVVMGQILVADNIVVVPVDPAPGDDAGTPATTGIFESRKDLEFLVGAQILVVATEDGPA